MKIVWYPLALDDLENLRAYIARDARANAEVVARRILEAVETLGEFSERGRVGRVSDTRELVIPRTPYLVAYRVREGTVEIL